MTTWPPLSRYIADQIEWWAWCGAVYPCDHKAKLNLQAIIEEFGDLSADDLKRRLKCICGTRSARVSLIPMGSPRAYLVIEEARKRMAVEAAARAVAPGA